jgi:hypothetical protein
MQLLPLRAGRYPLRHRRTTHSPDRHSTSATPGSVEQSVPTGDLEVRGNVQPPPGRADRSMSNSILMQEHGHKHKKNSQLSRSRAVWTHSHARGLPPKTPQAVHPGPISMQEPLPTHLFFFRLSPCGWLEGHELEDPHTPLQMTFGGLHSHVVGFPGG